MKYILITNRTLVDFVIKHHFKEIDLKDEDRFLNLFAEIVSQTADLIARWQSVGFAHGKLYFTFNLITGPIVND